MNQYDDEFPVKLIHAAGADFASVEDLKLYEIDRSPKIDVMTALYLPAMEDTSSFEALQNIIGAFAIARGLPLEPGADAQVAASLPH